MPPAAVADANQHVTLEAAEADAMKRAGFAHDLERARRQRRIRAFQLDNQQFLGKSRQHVAQQRDARVALRGGVPASLGSAGLVSARLFPCFS